MLGGFFFKSLKCGVIPRGFIAIVLALPYFYAMMIPDMIESRNKLNFLVPLSIIIL